MTTSFNEEGRFAGAPGIQARGAHLNKLRRAEGGAKNFGVFHMKNHDFTPKKIIFLPILGGGSSPESAPACHVLSFRPGKMLN
jgi:hypothetical protein